MEELAPTLAVPAPDPCAIIAYHDHSPSTDITTRTEYRVRSAALPDLSPDDLADLRRTFGDGWQYEVCSRAGDNLILADPDAAFGPYLVEHRKTYGHSTPAAESGYWHPLSIEATLYDAYCAVDNFAGSRIGKDYRIPYAIPTSPDSPFAAHLALAAQRWIEHDDFQIAQAMQATERAAARELACAAESTWRRLCATPAGLALAREWEACVRATTAAMAADSELDERLRRDADFRATAKDAQSALTIPARRKAIKSTMAYLRRIGITWEIPVVTASAADLVKPTQ